MPDLPAERQTSDAHSRSVTLQEQAAEDIPESASSNVRGRCAFEPYSPMIFMEEGNGAILTDVDGNDYVDLHCAVSSVIVGHRPQRQVDAVTAQVERGPYYSTPHEHEVDAARMLNDLIPASDKTKFISTGTEGVMRAMSIARAYTGKEKILKFEGMYHGHSDPMLYNVHPPVSALGTRKRPTKIPGGTGIPESTTEQVIAIPWNDTELLAETLERHGDEIAAIITEGYLSNSGLIFPQEGFLSDVERLAAEHDALFILDEVITGFRASLSGVQGRFDLEPDLSIFGKALANGYPAAAVSGKEEIMSFITGDPDTADFMGTFSGNPIATVATKANLELLTEIGEDGYDEMFDRGQRLVEGLREIADDAGHHTHIPDFAGYSHVYFTDEEANPSEWTEWRDVAVGDDPERWGQFASALIQRGVYVVPRPFGRFNLSHAHTDDDIDTVLEAAKGAFEVTPTS